MGCLGVNFMDHSKIVHRGKCLLMWIRLQDYFLYSLTVAEEELGCALLNRKAMILNVIILMLQRKPPKCLLFVTFFLKSLRVPDGKQR